jgi:hypothetical protein
VRQAAAAKGPRFGGQAQTAYISAPLGGLNTKDHPSVIGETESQFMWNCYPTSKGIVPRRPAASHATGFADQPESLMVYVSASGTETMFAAAGTSFFNASSAGAIGAAVVTGLTNAKWQSLMVTLSGGTPYLCCFNGADSPRYWDGSSWLTITGVSTPAITGLTTSTIVSAFVHQRRMWLVQANSLKVWYLPPDAVGGAASSFDLGGIATKGGYIMAGSTWTVDAGDGVNDYWAVITSKGQLIVYQGTDPSSSSTWALVGVWNIPEPLDRTCMYKYKNDLFILTKIGVISTARTLNGQSGAASYVTDKITPNYELGVRSPLSSLLTNTRWFLIEYTKDDLLLLCTQESDYVYVMDRSTGAWGQFALNIICATVFNGKLYWSATASGAYDKKIYEYATSTTASGSVVSEFSCAPSVMGLPAVFKKVNQVATVGTTTNAVTVYVGVGVNYVYPSLFVTSSYTSLNNLGPYLARTGFGTAITVGGYFETNASTYRLVGFNVMYEPGGIMGFSNQLS